MRIPFLAALLAMALAAGCKAQAPASPSTDLALNHRIEVLVRSHFGIPADVDLAVGQRQASEINGYDKLQVMLSRSGHSQALDFLVSKDGKTLARLDTFSLVDDPLLRIDAAGRPVRGEAGAKVTVVNFDDLECPYCGRMHRQLFPDTLERYKGLVRFVYKDFPLTEIHPWAMRAAVDSNCLGAQNPQAYWDFVDYIHAHGAEVEGEKRDAAKSAETLDRLARQKGTEDHLDSSALEVCLKAQDETKVRASMKEGMELGVDGTPALFVDGERLNGVVPEEQIWKAIDRALKAAGVEPPAASPAATPAAAPGAGTR
jgi:protein-disulfide isomerase